MCSGWTRRASAGHTPAFTDAGLVTERAAAHPESADALLLAAFLVAARSEPWQHLVVMRHARALLDAAAGGPAGEHLEGRAVLWDALVEASGVGAARTGTRTCEGLGVTARPSPFGVAWRG